LKSHHETKKLKERKQKMKTKTKIMVLAGILAAVLCSGSALAQPQDFQGGPPMGPSMRPMMRGPGAGQQGGPGMGQRPDGLDGMVGVIMHRLDLTDEQRDKIETIIDKSCSETRTAQHAVERAHRALEKAVAGDANEPAIRKAADGLGKAIGDEAVLKVKIMKEAKAVLTHEQIKKLDEIKTEMKARPARGLRQGRDEPRPPMPVPNEEE
jgi:Spy/CpxP family protein refolding chaperone